MVAALVLSGPADAYTVKGMGKCGTWSRGLDDRFWILGFISGANFASGSDTAKTIAAEDIYDWVGKYCKDHPGDDLADATTAFIKAH
jgi:hypothetical protein